MAAFHFKKYNTNGTMYIRQYRVPMLYNITIHSVYRNTSEEHIITYVCVTYNSHQYTHISNGMLS